MKTLQIDYMFIFDIDNTLQLLDNDRYDYAIVDELPDWWAHPEEKSRAKEMVINIDRMVASLHYTIGEPNDSDPSRNTDA
jgi:hypothetical protein